MADLSPHPPVEPSRGPWLGLGVGLVIVGGMLAYLIYSSRSAPERNLRPPSVMASAAADPYAASLTLTEVKMSQAENMLGGSSIYIEGKVTNRGAKTVTGATIEITFRNALNQVVQREAHGMMVILRREPADDVAALNVAPLKPGESREFRQTFERLSADWNRQYPELRITTVIAR